MQHAACRTKAHLWGQLETFLLPRQTPRAQSTTGMADEAEKGADPPKAEEKAADIVAVAASPLSLQLSLSLTFGPCAVRTFLTSRASRASRPRALAPCPSSILSKKPRASSFRALCLRNPSFIVSSNAFVRCRLLGGRTLSRPSLAVPYHRPASTPIFSGPTSGCHYGNSWSQGCLAFS